MSNPSLLRATECINELHSLSLLVTKLVEATNCLWSGI